ncbi:MAG TPA: Fic family protein [archaeon]|nr:Fic family protein [archaeon]
MVFVRKIKEYYVLVHPVRKGKKITQKTKYLGKKLPHKQRLDQLKKEFLREITEGKYKYFSKDEAESIENKKEKYREEIKKLSHLEREKHFENFMIRFTYDSSKLSGVKVTLRQTALILKDGIIPKEFKNLKTVKELENHERGVVAITKFRGKLSTGFLKNLHKILFSGVDDTIAGKLRSELERNVEIAGTPYVPPKWNELDKELDEFFKWHKANNRKFHPLELAALMHMKIISLQPFTDGNSRLSRLLMNWVLWKKNYPMIDIKVSDIENYYDALDKYQIEHDEKPFVKYIKEQYLET